MSIETKVLPYEVLFRLAENGAIAGAHCKNIIAVIDKNTGSRVSAAETDPRPLDLDNMGDVVHLINDGLVKLNAEIAERANQLSLQVDSQKVKLDELSAQLNKKAAELDLANNEISNLNKKAAELKEYLSVEKA